MCILGATVRTLFNVKWCREAALFELRLAQAVADCVYDNDVDVRREILSSVVLTGGLALTPGRYYCFVLEWLGVL